MNILLRRPQLIAPFVPGEPTSGYYNDMTGVVGHEPTLALGRLTSLVRDRRLANPVSIAQHGLGAWQRHLDDSRWLEVIAGVAAWLRAEHDQCGLIRYGFGMPHTYRLHPGWASAMAQGEAASFLVRAASALREPSLLELSRVVAGPLHARDSDLVVETPEGKVLQEYPTSPPSHVLNGWIFALWGLYDVGLATGDAKAGAAFEQGVKTLCLRLPLYGVRWNWSRYDLFPHRLTHVTSPFYHRLHIEQLRALDILVPDAAFASTAARWEAGSRNHLGQAFAVGRKVAFRVLEPRRDIR